MAKLNGVVTVSERIEYGGNVYALSTEQAVAGDIVRANNDEWSDVTEYGYYVMFTDSDDDVVFTDDIGDVCEPSDYPEDFTVFKRTASASTPQPRLAIGEYARVIGKGDRGAFNTHQFAIGEIVRVTNHCGETDRVRAEYLDGHDNWYVYNGYLERVTEAEAIGIQPQYTEVKRKARVGERIRIVKYDPHTHATPDSHVKVGGEVTVKRVDSDGDVWYVDEYELRGILFYTRGEYVVLEESAQPSAQPSVEPAVTYDKLAVGDYAKVTPLAYGNAGDYIGEVVKVTRADSERSYPYRIADLNGNEIGLANDNEIVRATDAEVSEAKRNLVDAKAKSRVGEYVKVIANNHAHNYVIGSVIKLVSWIADDDGYKAERHDGTIGNYIRKSESEFVSSTKAEFDAQKPQKPLKPSVKVGDSVRLTIADGAYPTYGYGYVKNGDIGVVTRINAGSGMVTFDFPNQTEWNGKLSEVTPLSSAEAEAFRKQAEIDAKQAEETAKWGRIGRKVNEYKRGDLVRVTQDNGSAGLISGEIVTVKDPDNSGVYLTRLNPRGFSAWTSQAWIKLVTPVEQRFDR